MSEELSSQEQLVLEQRYKRLDFSLQTGDQLDNKASTLLQSSSIVIGLTGAVAIPTFATNATTPWQIGALIFAFFVFLLMILAALIAWWPSRVAYPGDVGWDNLFNLYINQPLKVSYHQLLSDVEEAFRVSCDRNVRKGRLVRFSCFLFALQVAGILMLAIFSK